MIDEKLTPWLIEVNTNPCLEETSELLKKYLARMLDDAFTLTLDVIYPPHQLTEKRIFPVEGYEDTENMWKHFYTLKPQ